MQGGAGINEYGEQDGEFNNFEPKGLTVNPIGHVGLFATPSNMKSLEQYLGNFNGEQRTIAWTCAMMAWNLASKYVDEAIEKSKSHD